MHVCIVCTLKYNRALNDTALIGRWCCIVFHCKKSPRSCLSCYLEITSAKTRHSTPFSCCIITIIFVLSLWNEQSQFRVRNFIAETIAFGLKINFRSFMERKSFRIGFYVTFNRLLIKNLGLFVFSGDFNDCSLNCGPIPLPQFYAI